MIPFIIYSLILSFGQTVADECRQSIQLSPKRTLQQRPYTPIIPEIESFHNDVQHFEAQPNTDLTTPCIILCRDTTYTKLWNLDDWKDHSKHALSRYTKHIFLWPTSTTMHNILGAVTISGLWGFIISKLSMKYGFFKAGVAKFTITFTFLQAPILLLLTLRTNRALDRLLEARKAWGSLGRSTRSLMGITCAYILPQHPEAVGVVARYLAICGWVLKGMIRKEDDSELIQNIMKSVPEEAEWLSKQSNGKGIKRPHAVVCRLRNLFAKLQQDIDIPHYIMLRIEEILYDIEATTGVCNRILVSPIPPTYTRHTSRVLVMYLSMLPIALAGMGVGTAPVVVTVMFASYILIGIDEIGLEIENPFPLMPLWGISTGIQKEVVR